MPGKGGRIEGSKNKMGTIRDAFAEAFFKLGGVDGLLEWGEENKGAFYKIVAKILPKEIHGVVEHRHEDFIKRLGEKERLKELEQGNPVKMIDTDGVVVGNELRNEPKNGEESVQKP